MAERGGRADYGIDAPAVPIGLGAVTIVFALVTVLCGAYGWLGGWWWIPFGYAVFFALSTTSYLYTTRRGKFRVWGELLGAAGLTGGERVVDLGCGRGAVLVTAAHLLPAARPVGVDLWRSVDQSGNDPARTLANASAEGVAVDLITGDLRALPVHADSVDLVVSSLAIHNISDPAGRLAAVREATRILRPGGRLILVDYRHAQRYADELTRLGLRDVTVRGLGWRFWYGGPWGRSSVVTATR